MKRSMGTLAALIAVLLLTSVCSRSPDETPEESSDGVVVKIVSPEDGSKHSGNAITLEVELTGIEMVEADGDTSGATGHLHVFVDSDPVAPGDVIPMTDDIIHSTETTIVIDGLEPGLHSFEVIPGDGTHARIGASSSRIELIIEG